MGLVSYTTYSIYLAYPNSSSYYCYLHVISMIMKKKTSLIICIIPVRFKYLVKNSSQRLMYFYHFYHDKPNLQAFRKNRTRRQLRAWPGALSSSTLATKHRFRCRVRSARFMAITRRWDSRPVAASCSVSQSRDTIYVNPLRRREGQVQWPSVRSSVCLPSSRKDERTLEAQRGPGRSLPL